MRLGVVGLGFMGAAHLMALREVPGVTLAAVCSPDEKKLSGDLSGVGGNLEAGARFDFSGIKRFPVFEDLFRDAAIDAVDLCLPTFLHEPAAIAALRAGKHVLVEKPMALDDAACGRMIAAARESGRTLMAAQVLRFLPAYTALRGALPWIGPVRTAAFRRRCAMPRWGEWLQDTERSGGGVLDLLIHDVDMCLHLFGAPEALSACGIQDIARGMDVIDARFFYENGLTVTVSGGWHPGEFPFSMEYSAVGDGGAIEYSSAGAAPTRYGPEGTSALPLDEAGGYASEIAYFAECCAAGVAPARCPPEESAEAVRLARWMGEARKRNGEKVACK